MDSRYRIEIETEKIQTKLEKLIALDPADLKAIEDLWSVQTLRFENACSMTRKGKTWKLKS